MTAKRRRNKKFEQDYTEPKEMDASYNTGTDTDG